MFQNFLKITFRNLLRQKGYTFINIAGLAIGLACCFLILLFVLDELSYDRHYNNHDRIYRVAVRGVVGNQELNIPQTSSLMARTLAEEYPEVEHATRLQHTPNMLVRYGDRVFNETHFMWVDSNFFDVFSIPLLYGDPRTALKDDHTVVMTEETASKYFDNLSEAIGKIVTYEDGTPYRVTGIAKNAPENSHFHYGMLSPLSSWEWNWEEFWLHNFMYTYVMLRENSDPQQLEAKFPDFIRKYVAPHIQRGMGMSMEEFKASGSKLEYYLQPLTGIHLHSHLSNELEPNSDIAYIYIFSLIAFFILVIACINFMNLSTSRSAGRGKEVGIRKVLGSRRRQLIQQFLAESIIMTLIAVIFAVAIVQLVLPYFNTLAGKHLQGGFLNHWYIIPGILVISLIVGILAGSYPAFFLSSFKPVSVLKGILSKGKQGVAFRNVLVVIQFTISIVLFVCTFIVSSQLKYIQEKRLGFDKENIVVIKRGWAIGQNPDGTPISRSPNNTVIDAFKHDLLQNPQIISVAGSTSLPGKDVQSTNFLAEGASPDEQHPMNFFMADFDFADTYKLEFQEGRFYSREMASDSMGVVVNETAARILGFEKPYLGKRIGFPGNDRFMLHIIGVVNDFHYASLHKKIEPLLLGFQNLDRTYISVRIHPQRVPETVDYIKKTWDKYIPYKPFEYFFFDQDYDLLYKAEQTTAKLFTVFSVLAIFIACLGLFGLASFTTEKRTKEIGIRKAMGAPVSKIVLLLTKEFTRWVLVANIIAWPAAWYFMNQWLQNFAYRINPTIWIFIFSGILSLAIAVLTVSYQSIRAAIANPVESLRYE
ncbi:MAG: ABC transporter permease [Calditrichia bacterium]